MSSDTDPTSTARLPESEKPAASQVDMRIENVTGDVGNAEHDQHLHKEITYEEEPEHAYPLTFRTILALAALGTINGVGAMSSGVNTTIAFQIRDVGGAQVANWIANSSLLTTMALAPWFGVLSDRIGKKWLIVGGCVVNICGYVVAGSAHSVNQIILGQALTGTGFAGGILCIAAINEITPNRYRPLAFGFAMCLTSILAIIGAFAAAAYAERGIWRWAYFQGAFAWAFAGLFLTIAYFPPPAGLKRRGLISSMWKELDILGGCIFAGSVAVIVIALVWGGVTYPWRSASVVGPLVAGIVGLFVFGLWEWKGTSAGLFDHRLFVNRNFPMLMVVNMIDGMIILGVNVIWPQEIQTLYSDDPIRICVLLLPTYLIALVLNVPVGLLMTKTKSYRSMLVAALAWLALWLGLMATLNAKRKSWALGFTSMYTVGVSVSNVIPIVATTLSVPSPLLGTAGTFAAAVRFLGGIIAITILTSIHGNELSKNLPKAVTQAILSAAPDDSGLLPDIMGALANPQIPPVVSLNMLQPPLPQALIGSILEAVQDAQAQSWKWGWVTLSMIILATAIMCCFLLPVSDRMNRHVESAVEKSEVRDKQMKAVAA